ncbi:MAG: ABC transporter permease subunit [Planctomycetes bacterium]|nr:ABC transporter permease subunit [Planctomycetota bacterium]
MSEAAVAITVPPRRRTYTQQVIAGTFARPGAKIGIVFIILIAFCAVFAPFLANTHPFVMRTKDGTLSFPLFRFLEPSDVVLLIFTPSAIVLYLLGGWSATIRWLILLGVLAVSIPLCIFFVKPPETVVGGYERYRQMTRDGAIAFAIYAPLPYSPTDRLRDEPDARLQPPNRTHWFGTETNGGDVLSRMIHACRIALAVGFIATGIALVIGIFLGGLMGYFSGMADLLGMRLVEVFEAIPQLYLLLTFVAFFPRNLYIMMAIIGLTSWTGYARFVRAEFLKLRKQDYVQAAIACGLPLRSILFRHMLPNGVAPVLVTASFGVASAILAEAFLSFLGLGLVDEPSWGEMLSQAVGSTGGFHWWIATFPGMAIFVTVFAYNLIGEALRDAIDPHLKKAAHL